jgi:hypothetical protein
MNFLKHAYQQPLIFATGLAALVHSTWSLGTMFSGQQPAVESITNGIGYIHFAGWIVPALLIAFALDIGQIITSHEIRTRGMTKARGTTFLVFALATYYLQWLYMAHHMPLIELAEGISSIHLAAALQLRNMALWLIPALLPLSTLLYTFSSETDEIKPPVQVTPSAIWIEQPQNQELPVPEETPLLLPDTPILAFEQIIQETFENVAQQHKEPIRVLDSGLHVATCFECGWLSGEKENAETAQRALQTHRLHHCTANQKFSANGVKHDHTD